MDQDLGLGLVASRMWKNEFPLFNPPTLWASVMAAWADEGSGFRKHLSVFQSSEAILHAHEQYSRVCVFLYTKVFSGVKKSFCLTDYCFISLVYISED